MAFNQVVRYWQGYVASSLNTGTILAGQLNLLTKSSTGVVGIAADNSGNIYLSDAVRHIIMKIDRAGNISTLAGVAGTSGRNGTLTSSSAVRKLRGFNPCR